MKIQTKKVAVQFTGTLSQPSKMPCKSIGLPAQECVTGSKLVNVKGSVCEGCYALKGMYRFSTVKNAQYKRLSMINAPEWIDAMVVMIGNDEYFRWHDSGDIQSLAHLEKIAAVIERTPNCRHWIPTREKKIIRDYLRKHGGFPANATIRLSATMVDETQTLTGLLLKAENVLTSSVHTTKAIDQECIAYKQNGECRDCRACWAQTVPNISYPKH